MTTSSNIKKSALISYLGLVISIVAGLLYTPWMVKQIGQSDYGLYALVSTFLTYFIMDFGLGQAIARYIAKYRANKQEEKVNQLLGITAKLYLWISFFLFVILILVYIYIENIFQELSTIEVEKFKVIFLIAGLFSLISFPFSPLNGILIAYESFVFLKICDILNKLGAIILMVIALLLGYKLYAIVAINAMMALIIIVLKLIYIYKKTEININLKYKDKVLIKELFSFSIWMTIIGIAQRLLINLAPTLLGIYSGTTAIAIFSIGMLVESYVWTFANALNGLFLPRVTELTKESSNREVVLNLMIKVGRLQLFVIGILYVGFFTLGKEFILLWMGVDFEESYLIAICLILPGFVTLTQEIASTLLYVENEVKYKAILFISCCIFSLLLSFFLIPSCGALGASFSIGFSIVLFHLFGMNLVYYKVMNLNVVLFFKETFLKLGPAIFLSLVFGFFINYYYPADNFIFFFMKTVMIVLIYLILMWFVGLNKYEKELFKSILFKILPK